MPSVLHRIHFKGYLIQTHDYIWRTMIQNDHKMASIACRSPSTTIIQHPRNNQTAVTPPLPKLIPLSSQKPDAKLILQMWSHLYDNSAPNYACEMLATQRPILNAFRKEGICSVNVWHRWRMRWHRLVKGIMMSFICTANITFHIF